MAQTLDIVDFPLAENLLPSYGQNADGSFDVKHSNVPANRIGTMVVYDVASRAPGTQVARDIPLIELFAVPGTSLVQVKLICEAAGNTGAEAAVLTVQGFLDANYTKPVGAAVTLSTELWVPANSAAFSADLPVTHQVIPYLRFVLSRGGSATTFNASVVMFFTTPSVKEVI